MPSCGKFCLAALETEGARLHVLMGLGQTELNVSRAGKLMGVGVGGGCLAGCGET